jgi:hypothetical protein
MDLICIIFDLHTTGTQLRSPFSAHAIHSMLSSDPRGHTSRGQPVAGAVQYGSRGDYPFASTADIESEHVEKVRQLHGVVLLTVQIIVCDADALKDRRDAVFAAASAADSA